MAIATVSVVVPASGDGPVADISSLVGKKTVILGGTYEGSYTVLASQDGGVSFAPVATFDSDGRDPIEQTLAAAFQKVRVRTSALTTQTSPVTCEISGVSVPGANQFATLAAFPAGTSGTSLVVDTYAVFPPTGLEADIAILCTGSLVGTVLVEGSNDGAQFNVVGAFQAGPSPRPLVGLPAPLEFAPLVTEDKIRYLRVTVQGQVLATTLITVGGSVPVVAPSSTTLAEAYDNGTVPGDQTLTLLDLHGGGVVVDGTQAGFTGADSLKIKSAVGSVAFHRTGGFTADGNTVFNDDVGVHVAAPTAYLHLGAGTAAAGTAPLKINAGVLNTITEPGAVESDGVHLYWVDMGGTRWQLDGGGGGGLTLAQSYAMGAAAADQTFGLLDAKGGGLVVNAANVLYTGADAFKVAGTSGSLASFPRAGGLAVASSVSVASAAGAVWDEVALAASAVTLTGAPGAVTALAMVRVGHGTVNGAGNTVVDAYDLLVDTEPSGTATLAHAWSAGFAGPVQAQAGLVLGAGLAPPGESDVVFGAGAAAASAASTARLGYRAGGTQQLMASLNTGSYVPVLVGPTVSGFTAGSVAFGLASGQLGQDNAEFFWDDVGNSLGIGVAAAPTARLHLPATTAVAGTASLKIPSGVVLTVTEPGATEADADHIYWTNGAGTRLQLDNATATTTLAEAYDNGSVAADQTLVLLDAKGGGLVVNGTSVGTFTGTTALEVDVVGGSVNFYRTGGLDVSSTISRAAAAGTTWDEVSFLTSTLTLTGGPAVVTQVAQVRVGAGVVNGAGNTVTDAYDLLVDAAPSGTATLTRAWSAGFAGAVQAQAGLVLGTGLAPPGESDLVVGAGATAVSEANSARVGYLAGGTQQLVASLNTAAYVPILVGPTAAGFTAGAVPFGASTGQLTQDATNLKWDNTNKYLGVGGTPTARLMVVGGNYTADVAGTRNNILATGNFNPTSGTAAFNALQLSYTINQTGGANGTVTGLKITGGEVALIGKHNLIDAGAGATSFRVTNGGTIQNSGGITLGLTLTAPGENDIAFGAGATVVSQANTGRIGYLAGVTQKFVVSQNGAAYVPLLTSVTLAQAYAFGTVATDQTLPVLDANGGGLIVDGSSGSFTGAFALSVKGAASGTVLFPRVGGLSTTSSVSVAAAPGANWDAVSLLASTITLTGGPSAVTALAMVHVGRGVVNGAGNTVADAYNLSVDTFPNGTATLTRAWSAGFAGPVQARLGLSLGTAVAPPGENDIAMAAGGTNVSEVNTGRIGYLAGATQQFVASLNAGAYVPVLVGPVAAGFTTGRVPFGIASGQLGQDAAFFWDNTAKNLGVGATPTARIHVAASTATAGTASLKIPSGVVLTVTEPGATEADNNHIYWTNAAGTRLQLDNSAAATTLAQAYSNGAAAADQTLALLDTKGGGLIVDGTNVLFTGAYALKILDSCVATSLDQVAVQVTGTFAPASGTATYEPLNVAYTINQTGGANGTVTGIMVAATETSLVGSHDLLNMQVGGTSHFRVTSTGNVYHEDGLLAAPSISWRTDTTGGIYHVGTGTSARMGHVVNGGVVLNVNQFGVGISNTVAASSGVIPTTGTALVVDASKTLAAGAGQKWQGVFFNAATLTLTGSANPTAARLFEIGNPTISAASACNIVDFYTAMFGAASFVGSATATRSFSLYSLGNTKFGGGQQVHTTDVNAAGPYTVLATDYYLHVRYTATAAISINLPSIATVGDGWTIYVADSGYNAVANNITLVRNGTDKINNVAGNYTQNVSGSVIKLTANATTSNWEIS